MRNNHYFLTNNINIENNPNYINLEDNIRSNNGDIRLHNVYRNIINNAVGINDPDMTSSNTSYETHMFTHENINTDRIRPINIHTDIRETLNRRLEQLNINNSSENILINEMMTSSFPSTIITRISSINNISDDESNYENSEFEMNSMEHLGNKKISTLSFLNKFCPKSLHLNLINENLSFKDHQLTAIYAMRQFEDYGINIIEKPPRGFSTLDNFSYMIDSNFGILGDSVGTGKTYIILGLLLDNLIPKNRNINICGTKLISLRRNDKKKCIKTNLIIVPNMLVTQWTKIFKISNLKTYHILKKIHADKLKYISNDDLDQEITNDYVEYWDVIIISSTMYKHFNKFYDVKWSRIIIDEMIDVTIHGSPVNWNCNFIWFLTGTPKRIHTITKRYIKDIISLSDDVMLKLLKYVIVQNDLEYIEESMHIPPPIHNVIICDSPFDHKIARQYINSNIAELLNAGDIKGAIIKLNCDVDTDENILQIITKQINIDIHNTKIQLDALNKIIPINKKIHSENIDKTQKELDTLCIKLDSIEKRINSYQTDCCPVCMDKFDNLLCIPGILPCCNQLFCFSCLVKVSPICPLCRTIFILKNIKVIKNNLLEFKNKNIYPPTKIDALIKIILSKKKGKFLLFSNHDASFNNILEKFLQENITFAKIKGHMIDNIISQFSDGTIKVLLLNAKQYGSGLNLQMATDIIIYHHLDISLEIQVIGRAHRFGRTTSINVHHLLFDNEGRNQTIITNNNTNSNDFNNVNSDNYFNLNIDEHYLKFCSND